MKPARVRVKPACVRVARTEDHWALAPFAVFDGSPIVWVDEGDTFLVLTSDSLAEITSEGAVNELKPLNLEGLYPTTMVLSENRTLYIGMRFFVLKLQPTNSGWDETWFVPTGCIRTQIRNLDCECLS